MLYQPILSHENSLAVVLENLGDFPIHKHYEIEILYCAKGSYKVIINNEPHLLTEGMLAFIPCLVPHETVKTNEESLQLLIEAGPLFLGNYFDIISFSELESFIFDLNESSCGKNILPLLEEIIEQKSGFQPNELIIKGNVTKIFGLFLNEISYSEAENQIKENTKIKNIEKALDLIHHSYSEQITVDIAAQVAGYGKSNFCKIFKNTTGVTFHQYLNNYRIERSKFFLRHTDMSVFEVGEMVGFNDSKTFCRVFKEFVDTTPKSFAKNKNTLKN